MASPGDEVGSCASSVDLSIQVTEPLIGSSSSHVSRKQEAGHGELHDPGSPGKAVQYGVAFTVVFLGVFLGFLCPTDDLNPKPWDRVSSVMGWMYFVAWSISFYPQLIANRNRKSVVGLSFDFVAYAWIGFFCYTCFTCGFYFSPSIRQAYAKVYHSSNDVQANDVLFAVHALATTSYTIVQCILYERGTQKVSGLCMALCCAFLACAVGGAAAIGLSSSNGLMDGPIMWLWYLYSFSIVKVALTIVKYIPQVILNQETQSTKGWSIGNVLLDITGGVLSISQSLLDCISRHDWSVIIGNPIRFSIGFWSIVFDVIFILQHYVWFPANAELKFS